MLNDIYFSGIRTSAKRRVTISRSSLKRFSFVYRRLRANETWHLPARKTLTFVILLGGICHVRLGASKTLRLGPRSNVFNALSHTLIITPHTESRIVAADMQVEIVYVETSLENNQAFAAKVLRPSSVKTTCVGRGAYQRFVRTIADYYDGKAHVIMVSPIIT